MESFLLAFIPLFVAIDPIGTVPLFLGFTEGVESGEKKKLAFQAVATAFGVGISFAAAGRWIFLALSITPADFRVAGGILLLVFSIREIFGSTALRMVTGTTDRLRGVVPLGIPLIAGPALLTTLLILQDEYSFGLIAAALSTNLAISFVLFRSADAFAKVVGQAFSRVVAKVIAIFLAAIGVMMIRRGMESFFGS